MLHSVPDPRLPLSSATPAVQFTVAAVPAPRAQAAVHPAPLPRRCAQGAYPPPKINPEAVSQPRHHATFLKLSSPLRLSLALTSPRVSPPHRDAIPASTSQSAPATSIKRRHLTLPPLPHPPLINGLPTAIERVQRLEEFLLLPERMRGGGGGSGLGFPGGVLVEEEGEEVVSAPERPMRRRRRRWGVEVDDGYSPSSTGGGGSSCCDSFGCDSVGPCSSLLS